MEEYSLLTIEAFAHYMRGAVTLFFCFGVSSSIATNDAAG